MISAKNDADKDRGEEVKIRISVDEPSQAAANGPAGSPAEDELPEVLEGELVDEDPEIEEEIMEENLEAATLEMEREFAALSQDLEETRAKAEEYLNGWQRALADFTNYKRRIERDQQQTMQNTVGSVVKRYLPILDDLERALNNRPKEGEGAVWANGIELIYRKFLMSLEADGVKPMEAEGQLFDPNLHEAISQEPSPEHESGQIIEVLQKGYLVGERVLRPAVVRVAE